MLAANTVKIIESEPYDPQHQLALQALARERFDADELDLTLLDRALRPERHGLDREPLNWPEPGTVAAEAVLLLLSKGQVPTPAAVERAATSLRARDEWGIDTRRLVAEQLAAHRAQLGRSIAAVSQGHWDRHGHGPTWRAAARTPEVSAELHLVFGELSGDHRLISQLMAHLHRAEWLASTAETGSLCPGPAYYADLKRQPHKPGESARIGWRVACAVGICTAKNHGRAPTWDDIAHTAQLYEGRLVFTGPDDARSQARWLVAHGWVRAEGSGLRRGKTAHRVARERQSARNIAAA